MWLEMKIDRANIMDDMMTYADGFKVKFKPKNFEKLAITNEFSGDTDEYITFAFDEDGEGTICYSAEKDGKKIDLTYLKNSMRSIQEHMYLEEGEING